jgi:ubiquinone biosynthesis protein
VIAAVGHLFRLTRAGFVFAREGVLGLVDPEPLPGPARLGLKLARLFERPSHAGSTVKLSAALTRLGPTYVKLGQFLATRPDIVGPVLARDLESLQDKMAPFPQAQAEATVAAALGKPVAELFASFGPAVAAASIAQVHKAEISSARPRESGDLGAKELDSRLRGNEREGLELAVKVLRPGVERRFKSDLVAADRGGRYARAFGHHRDGPAAGSRRHRGNPRQHEG